MLRIGLLLVWFALFEGTSAVTATSLYATASVNPGAEEGGGCEQTQGSATASILKAACASGFTFANVYSGTGLSTATAQYDHLSAYTSQFLVLGDGANGEAGPVGTSSSASAGYGDRFSFTGAISPAVISITATIEGSSGPGANGTGVYGQGTLQIGNAYCNAFVYVVAGTSSCTVTAPINAQVSFEQILTAVIEIGVGGTEGDQFTFTSDFTQTAYISNIQFFNANMQPLQGVQFVSDSGVSYLSQVPEPADGVMTLIAAAGGFLAQARGRRRRRRDASPAELTADSMFHPER